MVTAKGGKVFDKKLRVKLPTIGGLALYIGVCEDTLHEWAKVHPRFSVSLKKVKTMQAERLLDKGLSGDYNSTIAKLILSANHGMSDRTDHTSGGEKISINFDNAFTQKTTDDSKE